MHWIDYAFIPQGDISQILAVTNMTQEMRKWTISHIVYHSWCVMVELSDCWLGNASIGIIMNYGGTFSKWQLTAAVWNVVVVVFFCFGG